MKRQKIVTVCQGGNNRSVCLGFILKHQLGLDSVAIGIETAGEELQTILFKWAEKIILTDKRFEDKIPKKYKKKLLIWDVGPDRYGVWWHPELISQFHEYIKGSKMEVEKV